ncbi:FAD-binding oxidoreductase [Nocardioides bigeumensis]|uniref:FAD-binding FR-type domain-containing protein n=1 Tax=Nocardioides bigeumensis TaxID=433657 RepID=A0ABN2XYI5_9ACTN
MPSDAPHQGEPSYVLRVGTVVRETADTVSVSLEVPDHLRAALTFRPGQFLTVAVPSLETGLVARAYSLSSSPLETDRMTFSVKWTPDGYASKWLHDNVEAGDQLRVLRPSGIFSPRSLDADLLMYAAGSGITPMMSIIRTVLAPIDAGGGAGRMALFYANRDRASVVFAAELDRLAAAHPGRLVVEHWLEEERGLPTGEAIREHAAAYLDRDSFCCGPKPFMDVVAAELRALGFPRERRHQERFVSLGGNPFGTAQPL